MELRKKLKDYALVTRHIVNYGDCNQLGNLFGGTLLSWLDEAASIYCREVTDNIIVVTKAIDKMEFHTPTKLGETISIYCRTVKEGTTSITIELFVTNIGYEGGEEREIAQVTMVWVALDSSDGKPLDWKAAKAKRKKK